MPAETRDGGRDAPTIVGPVAVSTGPNELPGGVPQIDIGRAHRPVQSGLSALARGEAAVWITGGMLVVAVGMIVALLSFVLVRGAATFWPLPLAVYTLHDGTIVAGEPQSTETFRYDAAQLSALGEKAAAAARARLGDEETASAERVYVRVANFDLSGKHFDYVNKFELRGEPFYAPDAWLLERLHSGRFYGMPGRLTEQFAASLDPDVARLDEAIAAAEMIAGYAGEDEGRVQQVEAAVAALRDAREAAAEEYLRSVIRGTPLGPGERWEVSAEEGEWQPFDATEVDESDGSGLRTALAVRVVTDSPNAIWAAYHHAQWSIAGLRQRHEQLQEELAANDEALRETRLTLRQAEIDHGVAAVDAVAEFEGDWTAIAVEGQQLANDAAAVETIRAQTALSAAAKETLDAAWAAAEADRRAQIEAFEADLATRTQVLDRLPPEVGEAAASLRTALAATAVSQLRISREMERVEAELQSASIRFNSTSFATPRPLEPAGDTADAVGSADELPAAVAGAAAEAMFGEGVDPDGFTQTAMGGGSWWLAGQGPGGRVVAVVSGTEDGWVIALADPLEVPVEEVVRAYLPNQLGLGGKLAVYGSRWWEFVSGTPRDAGMEGGYFPAIWGTVVMTMIMALFVVPFGVLAALYLREYAGGGWFVGLLRISINNLAGVPSVVYGVFGLAFFCYVIGGYIDGGPDKAGIEVWPFARWVAVAAALAVTSVAAFFLSFLSSGSPATLSRRQRFMRSASGVVWFATVIGFIILIAKNPFFDGFYTANLPNPTFGKGGLLWASLTLALLTLPVVIVATEEALAAVPNSLREGSYACGAGKWQTIKRIVLPHARPGILTGTILAMARGAGEVAPMMLVGALPMVVDLPLDAEFPFFHGSRSFMHLGFQIYALGFQGQNSEAAKPMVFTTTLLLILIVLLLNLAAIVLRARLRRRFQANQF